MKKLKNLLVAGALCLGLSSVADALEIWIFCDGTSNLCATVTYIEDSPDYTYIEHWEFYLGNFMGGIIFLD
jgi:hypothetical protein